MRNTLTLGLAGSGKSTLSKFSMSKHIDMGLSVLVVDPYKEFLDTQEVTMYSCLLDKFIGSNRITEGIKKTTPQLTVVISDGNPNSDIVGTLQKILDKAVELEINTVYISQMYAIEFLRNLSIFIPYKDKLCVELDTQILNDSQINTDLVRKYFGHLCITKIVPKDIAFLTENFNVDKDKLISTLTSPIGQSQLYEI